jgi:voltage-gated potassium channel
MNLRRRLILALLLMLVMIFAAAMGYRLLGGPSVNLLDAIYMAVITIATVGYGEVVDTSANPPLRIFNILGIPLTHVLLYIVVAFPACTILAYGTGSMLTAC